MWTHRKQNLKLDASDASLKTDCERKKQFLKRLIEKPVIEDSCFSH